MSERITQELRDAVTTGARLTEFDGHILDETVWANRAEFENHCDAIDSIHANLERENKELRQRTMYPAETERINMLEREVKRLTAECTTQRNNFDQATSAREHWKSLYEQSLEQIHDLEHDVEMWRDRAEDMRMERDDALKEHHAWAPESHYMMLPKDADGEPIHVGDVVEWADGSTCEVVGIGDGGTLYYMDEIEGTIGWTNADGKHHHHEDSWERIIEDAFAYAEAPTDMDKKLLVDRCKALAGDAE